LRQLLLDDVSIDDRLTVRVKLGINHLGGVNRPIGAGSGAIVAFGGQPVDVIPRRHVMRRLWR
jgi:hypothetical protein